MHILFLTPGFPNDEEETSVLTYFQNYLLALNANTRVSKISVVSIHYPFEQNTRKWHGMDLYCLGGANVKFPFSISLWSKAEKLIKQINLTDKLSVIHSLWLKECAIIGNRIQKNIDIPHLCTVMGTELVHFNKYRYFMKLSDYQLVSVSKRNDELLKKKGKNIRSSIIPWGLSPSEDKGANNERDIDILGVGSLNELKQFDQFLEVIKSLKKDKSKISCCLIGAGPKRKSLERMAIQLGIKDNIEFLGDLANEDVLAYMERSKVLLHPSRFESQGYVFLEALSKGMSIVSRDVGIASISDRWEIIADSYSMSMACKGLIDNQSDFVPTYPYPIAGTVAKYCDLYDSIMTLNANEK